VKHTGLGNVTTNIPGREVEGRFWCPAPVEVRTNTQTYRETYREDRREEEEEERFPFFINKKAKPLIPHALFEIRMKRHLSLVS
jgi:hypothetical protein